MIRGAAPALLCAIVAVPSLAGAGTYSPRNLAPGIAATGDASCSSCHAREAATYPLTAMGRSMSLPADWRPRVDRGTGGSVTFDNPVSARRYRIDMTGDGLTHTEIRIDAAGKETLTVRRGISYVLGSGDRGQTFLHRSGDRLYQSAVAYRPHRDGWGMAAGFEARARYDFMRPVAGPCLFCHANRALHVGDSLNEYRAPYFDGLAVGCERCHGPGGLHVAERRSLPPTPDGIDTSIVNPRRLDAPRREHVCFQCHLQGSARVVKAGRLPHEYLPGMLLSDTFAVYHRASDAGGFSVVSHVERLRESRCWAATGGGLDCLTCHDPHRTPRGDDAVAQFRAACLTCHKVESCGIDAAARARDGDPEDCVRCHMARLPPSDAPHTLFTDHRIARLPGGAGPSHEAAGPVRLVNFMEGDAGAPRDLGLAYMIYATAEGDPDAAARGASILEPIMARPAEDINATRLIVSHMMATGRAREARPVLEALVARAPRIAEFRVLLARILKDEGRIEAALAMAKSAVDADAGYAPSRLTYGDLLEASGRLKEAEAEHRAAAQADPSMAAAHARLADHALRKGDKEGARASFRTAVLLDPELASARLGLARLALDSGDPESALRELDAALPSTTTEASRMPLLLHRAMALAQAGRIEEAVGVLDDILLRHPDHPAARAMRNRIRPAPGG